MDVLSRKGWNSITHGNKLWLVELARTNELSHEMTEAVGQYALSTLLGNITDFSELEKYAPVAEIK